ncbi:MAG: hypothetical protein LBL24_02695 [Bacteroidales bacterium]|jgi:hypothetical protein|nr:hypothetical protein [Bacteroidales bacterium]
MMKNTVYLILTAIILVFPSCKSQESIYEEYVVPNGHSYPGRALDVVTHSGKERIEIEWKTGADPKLVKARISWNNDTEGVDIDLQPDEPVVRKMIEPLDENTYTFLIRTYDARGNVSVPVEATGTVYGEMFESSLQSRRIKSRLFDGQDLTLEWDQADHTDLGVRLTYTDIHDETHTVTVDNSATVSFLPDFNVDQPLLYYSSFKPDSLAIDIFQAPLISTMIDPNIYLSKDTWAEYPLSGDVESVNGTYTLRLMWDEIVNTGGNFFHSVDAPNTFPCTFTWDLGKKAILSRMKMWPRTDNAGDRWNRSQVKRFEIYGSLAPNPDGSLDGSWALLGAFDYAAPSGGPGGSAATDADIALARAGIDFEFPAGAVTARYIRFKAISTFITDAEKEANNNERVLISEISFWGRLIR